MIFVESTTANKYSFIHSFIHSAKRLSDKLYIRLFYFYFSRYPWKHMAHGFCYRQQCKKDFDCCRRWNICDLSARVCRDCWYGSTCRRESDCCEAYPYCRREYEKNEYGNRVMIGGQCVDSYS